MKYLLTDHADQDLDAIWDRIAANNGTRIADRMEQNFHAAFELLSDFPLAGHTRADVRNRNYRFWSVHSFIIGYRIDKKPLIIARVVHGARNFKSLFR